MIGFTHATVGGLIGRFLPLPIALPLALASHFAADALPHYGLPQQQRDLSRVWRYFFTGDFIATCGLAILAIATRHYALLACGLVAVIPDVVWLARVFRTHSFNMSSPKHWFAQWHANIQHWERPWGIYLELPLAVVLFYCLYQSVTG